MECPTIRCSNTRPFSSNLLKGKDATSLCSQVARCSRHSRRPATATQATLAARRPSFAEPLRIAVDSRDSPGLVVESPAQDWAVQRSHSDQLRSSSSGNVIRVIATDVDGTLLDSKQRLSERTENALKLAMDQGVEVVLATGKARGPWVSEVMSRLNLTTPGVFLQGLMVCSADGTVLYERCLEEEVAQQVVDVAAASGITLTAYCGDRILCEQTNEHTDRLIGYGEPVPEAVGPLAGIVGSTPIHKLLFMADDSTLAILRRNLETQLAGRATLVTALHGMLEVLPLGASKAVGLCRVLKLLGHSESSVMAAGDGENDIEMLRMAGLAVAMGNAMENVKTESHYITLSNDQDGLAHAVERFALKPGFWCWD